jgi:hypothetical protein
MRLLVHLRYVCLKRREQSKINTRILLLFFLNRFSIRRTDLLLFLPQGMRSVKFHFPKD